MNGLEGWVTVILCGIVTLAIRACFVVLPPNVRLPAWLTESLRYVAAAVLPALVAPAVLFQEIAPGQSVNGIRVLAAVVAGIVAVRSRSVMATMIVGMAVLWLAKAWVAA